jgi:hypothetical protein
MSISNNIYKSETKGVIWEDITGGLPEININTIVFDKTAPEGLYVGTDAGVFYREDGMDEWVLHGTGLPYSVEVTDIEIYHDKINRDESRLRASTYGRGMWEIPLAQTSGMIPPSLLNAVASDDAVELEWNPPFYAQNIIEYIVYRNGEIIGTTRGTSFLDREVETEVTYNYYITARYGSGREFGPSNTARATPVGEIELPYSQDFEKGSAGWKAKFNFEGWEHGTAEELGIQGNDGLFFGINSGLAGPGVHVNDYLFTPEIDLSTFAGRTISLRFNYAFRKYRNYDKMSVVYRPSPSDEWVELEKLRETATNSWTWQEKEINLPEEALTEEAQIGFFYDDSNEHGWGAGVDLVELFHNTTSVNLLSQNADIKVFPNPNKGMFEIRFSGLSEPDLKIFVYDVRGRAVYNNELINPLSDHVERIDLSDHPAGIYQLVIRSGHIEYTNKINVQ